MIGFGCDDREKVEPQRNDFPQCVERLPGYRHGKTQQMDEPKVTLVSPDLSHSSQNDGRSLVSRQAENRPQNRGRRNGPSQGLAPFSPTLPVFTRACPALANLLACGLKTLKFGRRL